MIERLYPDGYASGLDSRNREGNATLECVDQHPDNHHSHPETDQFHSAKSADKVCGQHAVMIFDE